jgi:sec-independent protein translocase protein TatA
VLRTLEGPVGLILILILVAIFAGPKLPGAAKGIAQSIKIFRKEVKGDDAKDSAKAGEKKSGNEDETSKN